jgi:hypothetical protein
MAQGLDVAGLWRVRSVEWEYEPCMILCNKPLVEGFLLDIGRTIACYRHFVRGNGILTQFLGWR